MPGFAHLFTSLRIGNVTVRNRIGMGPHGLGFAIDKCPTDRAVHYYAERAKGGVGLIVTEAATVHPTGDQSEHMVCAYDPRVVPAYRRIADAVHAHGAKVFGQIWHQGREYNSYSGRALWGPSGIASPATHETPHELDHDEIRELEQAFASSAGHLQDAGLDGVEISCGHGYLIHQFMSPWCNLRQDEYGGSLDNRLRFALETISAVRQRVGNDFVVGVRVSGDEFTHGGLSLEDMKIIARELAATREIDYISVSVGNNLNKFVHLGDMTFPLAPIVYMAAAIKEVVQLPILTILRINDPILAEQIIASGQADMTLMVRALIADPELPNKAKDGLLDDIRPCIACLQECRKGTGTGPVGCTMNPMVGREEELGVGTLRPAARAKKVVVVGGGPAGLEVARVAALRGHAVALFERNKELGGQINIAKKVPNRIDLGNVVRYLEGQAAKAGVELRLGQEADVQDIMDEAPDAVVIATGANPCIPDLPGVTGPNVHTVWDVLEGRAIVGQNVVVVDGGEGFWQCCGTAEFLAAQDKSVTIMTPSLYVGMEVPRDSLTPLYQRLLSKRVRFVVSTVLKGIRRSERALVLSVSDVFTGEQREVDAIDTVVLAFGAKADDRLYRALKGRVAELFAIGDCYAPRKIPEAIREGHRVGRAL